MTVADRAGAKNDGGSTAPYIVRFSRAQRIEHVLVMVLFVTLCLTGFPQKFYTHGWAEALVAALGGIDQTRLIHHLAGYTLALVTVIHFASALSAMFTRSRPFSMMPTRKDFEDVFRQLRHYLGTDRQPLYDRFTYKEKFEYWGLVMGNVIMITTGFVLAFPLQVTALFPGVLIPAAKMAHSNEGLMALMVITFWHMFNVHLSPETFPIDKVIFTGKMSRERYEHEHPLELARLEGRPPPSEEEAHAPAPSGAEPRGEGER
jgi:cytochrome b subunit of formate dehydrogenase